MSTTKKSITFKTAFNSYSTLEVIGEGGSGRVFKATDSSGTIYAIKTLHPNNLTTDKVKRFKNETHFCLRNQHKNIVTISDYGLIKVKNQDCPFYVMPFYAETLRTLISQKIPLTSVLPYFSQILDGVEDAHLRNVWHRDLKPENILFKHDTDSLVIADFGVARFVKEHLQTLVVTKPSARLANFQYAAPEQRSKQTPVDQRADIYALGLILNEMFTREIIYGTSYKTIGSISPEFSYLDDIVEMMIRQSPQDRLDSIDSVKQKLIAKRNEFVSRQRLSLLQNKVVSRSETDDPLVLDPIHITGFDYHNGELACKLNKSVSQNWVSVFRNIIGVSFNDFISPQSIRFYGNTAVFKVYGEERAPISLNMFKEYLTAANRDYAKLIEEQSRREEEEERARLRREIAEEEQRQRVLSRLSL